jgi:hypothetical protein
MRVRVDTREVKQMLDRLRQDQVPFATATAINALADRVAKAETAALPSVFDKATPFTLRAFGIQRATKAVPYAVVFAKDRQSQYLSPYEDGGKQALLGKRALLNPKDIRLNAFNNLPKNTLARLKGRQDVFIGTVKTKSGPIAGVWQRVPLPKGTRGRRKLEQARGAAKATDTMRLLIRWGDPQAVQPKLHFSDRARSVVATNLQADFNAAIAKAIATAR